MAEGGKPVSDFKELDMEKYMYQLLLDMSNKKNQAYGFSEVKVKPNHVEFLFGNKGANAKKLREDTGAFIIFPTEKDDKKDVIFIFGKHKEVDKAKSQIEEMIKNIEDVVELEMELNPKHRDYFLDTSAALVHQICGEFEVAISFPRKRNKSNKIFVKIKGQREKANLAKDKIEKLIAEREPRIKLEIEVAPEYCDSISVIDEQAINDLNQYHEVIINLPENTDENNTISITGIEADVLKAKQALWVIVENIKTINDTKDPEIKLKFEVPSKYHGLIVGKKGKVVDVLKETYGVTFDLPKNMDEGNIISISGVEADVLEAKEAVLGIVENWKEKHKNKDTEISLEIDIPFEYHGAIIGIKGNVVLDLNKTYNVKIKVPKKTETSNTVTISGLEPNVLRAKQAIFDKVLNLLRHAKNRRIKFGLELDYRILMKIKIPSEYHGAIVGTKGNTVNELNRAHNVTIDVPKRTDESNIITFFGLEPGVRRAKQAVLEIVESIETKHENKDPWNKIEFEVLSKYHGFIVGTKGKAINELIQTYNVVINIPKNPAENNTICISGLETVVLKAKQAIVERVKNFKAKNENKEPRIKLEIEIPSEYHGSIIGAKGKVINELKQNFIVSINIPKKLTSSNSITISGLESEVLKAKQAMLEIVQNFKELHVNKDLVIKLEVEIPSEYHNSIIGAKGKNVNDLNQTYKVTIQLPKKTDESNTVIISGFESDVLNAKQAVLKLVENLKEKNVNKRSRIMELKFEVNREYYRKLIGPKGQEINKIKSAHNVYVKFPEKEEIPFVKIIGSRENVVAAKDDLLERVRELESRVECDQKISPHSFSEISSPQGNIIGQITNKYNVDIDIQRVKEVARKSWQLKDVNRTIDHLLDIEMTVPKILEVTGQKEKLPKRGQKPNLKPEIHAKKKEPSLELIKKAAIPLTQKLSPIMPETLFNEVHVKKQEPIKNATAQPTKKQFLKQSNFSNVNKKQSDKMNKEVDDPVAKFQGADDIREILFIKQVAFFQEETSKNLDTFNALYQAWSISRKSSIIKMKGLRDAIIYLKGNDKIAKSLISEVSIVSGIGGIIGGSIALAPLSNDLSLIAPTLLGIGSPGDVFCGATKNVTRIIEKKKIVLNYKIILKELKEDEVDLQQMLDMLKTILKMTTKFSVIMKGMIGEDVSLLLKPEDNIDWLYKQVKLYSKQSEHLFPYLKKIDLKYLFVSLQNLRNLAITLKDSSVSVNVKKSDSVWGPSLTVLRDAFEVIILNCGSSSFFSEEGYEKSKRFKDLNDIIVQLQKQAIDIDRYF